MYVQLRGPHTYKVHAVCAWVISVWSVMCVYSAQRRAPGDSLPAGGRGGVCDAGGDAGQAGIHTGAGDQADQTVLPLLINRGTPIRAPPPHSCSYRQTEGRLRAPSAGAIMDLLWIEWGRGGAVKESYGLWVNVLPPMQQVLSWVD